MIRAFFAAGCSAVAILFFVAVVIAGVTEKMSAQQAGNGLLLFGAIDCLVIAASVWLYRALGAAWGTASPPTWSVVLFGVLATAAGALLFVATAVLLNR